MSAGRPPTALLVEDAEEYVVLGTRVLEREGFRVHVARDGERGVELAREVRPELLLVDVSLPGMDGFEVCRAVRRFSDAYVVMVTARDDEIEKVVGFRVGADDYVTKPYSVAELSARIGAVRRRPREPRTPQERDFGALVVDPVAREARLDGQVLDLTKMEFDLLDLLTGSPRRAFTRPQVLEHLWGTAAHGDDHVVDVHVANLRRKLGESAADPRHVRTVRGVGYRFDPA